jgi:IS5 family transposase
VATAANVHDSVVLEDLLHGQETDVWGDSAYQGQSEVIKGKAPKARERTNKGLNARLREPGRAGAQSPEITRTRPC